MDDAIAVTKPPILNPDGYSIKGCSYIYAPRGQAGEYAPLSANPYRGCGHKCSYCYVPLVLKMKREEFDSGAFQRPNFLWKLKNDAAKYKFMGIETYKILRQVMLSFTTDPFNPFDMSLTRPTIEVLIENGFDFCTLTKGGKRALGFMDLFRPERDAFASTLTSVDDAFSLKWERGAALASERIQVLKKFHDAGIFTWVSLEPTLSVDASLEVVKDTHEFVDLYKVGRANYLPMTGKTNWEDYTKRMIDLLQQVGAKHYIKHDLQKYLPEGYFNPQRIQQNFGSKL